MKKVTRKGMEDGWLQYFRAVKSWIASQTLKWSLFFDAVSLINLVASSAISARLSFHTAKDKQSLHIMCISIP